MVMTQEDKIVKFLLVLGIKPTHVGFRATVYGLEMILKNWDVLDRITKEIYPDVGKRIGITSSQVERNIRYAIECLFQKQDRERVLRILELTPNGSGGRYTNTEFLMACAMKLKRAEA